MLLAGLVCILLLGVWLLSQQKGNEYVKVEVAATQSFLERVAIAIQSFEGYFPGSRAFRNNNPGNLKWASWEKATGKDKDGFAVYATFDDGWSDLLTLLGRRATQHPEWSLLDLFNSYAPATDNNDPLGYASFVAQQTGLDVNTKLGEIA